MKKLCYSIFLLLFFIQDTSGQLIYSLDDDVEHVRQVEKKLESATTDSAKAYLYLKLSSMNRLIGDTTKAKEYLEKGIALSDRSRFIKGAAFFYKAQSLYQSRNIPLIESVLMKGDSILDGLTDKESFRIRGFIWHAYGTFQQMKGGEDNAMDAFLNKALPYSERSADAFLVGNVNKAIGMVFMNANQREKADRYLEKAMQQMELASTDNPTRLESLVEIYITAVENYAEQNKLDSARINLDKAFTLLAPHPTSNLYLVYYYSEGVYFDKLKQYAAAIKSFDKGIALGKNVPPAQAYVNRLKFARYRSLRNSANYTEAIATMTDLLNSPLVFATDKKTYYKELSETYAATGNKAEAYRWATQYITLSDSLYEARFQHDVIELEKKYNEAENQKKISLLNAEKQKALLTSQNNKLLAWLLGIAVLFLLSVTLLGWKYISNTKKLAHEKERGYQQHLKEIGQEQQLQLTQALLNGEERERKRLAGDLHDGLGGMLAGVKLNLSQLASQGTGHTFTNELPAIITQLDKSVNELRRIARNMMPESLLNSGLENALRDMCHILSSEKCNIEFQAFNIETDIAQDMQISIYRIVQELLANTIRHADATKVLLQCSQNEQAFFITVEDNGKGFDQGNINGKGIGLTNVKNRVDYLKGKLDIDTAPAAGTIINIEFNVSH